LIRLEDRGRVEKYIRRCFGAEVAKRIHASTVLTLDPRHGTVYAIPRDRYEIMRVIGLDPDTIVGGGTHLGWLFEDVFIPSVGLFRLVKTFIDTDSVLGCAAICGEQGVKAFLYGNDVLVASVQRIIEPFERGLPVAVIDSFDNEIIGVGIAAIDARELEELRARGEVLRPAVLNVFDLGASIRSEKLFMEIPRDRLKSLYRRLASRR